MPRSRGRVGAAALVVVHRQDDDAFGTREDEGGVGAALGIAGEPGHVAMLAFGDPLLKQRTVRGGLRGRDAAVVEAQSARFGNEGGLEVCGGELAVVGDDWQWFVVVGKKAKRGRMRDSVSTG